MEFVVKHVVAPVKEVTVGNYTLSPPITGTLVEQATQLATKFGIRLTGDFHEVKSWTHLYDAHTLGGKSADMRNKRDRVYRVGDILRLRRFDFTTGEFTGEVAHSLIGHIISNETPCALSSSDLSNSACILSLHLLEHFDATGTKL